MLSYQHTFHAGSAADVHKHAMLAFMLDYMAQKDKPLSYIETHAGRGVYDLGSPEALKTGEAQAGVLLLEGRINPAHPYRQALAQVRASRGDNAYPGSPLLAAITLREQDTLHLAELHPYEHRILTETVTPWGAHIHLRDGFALALAITPPTPRRGLMLIDPSYEVKSDYAAIPGHLAAIHRRWAAGTLVLWYPVLASGAQEPMLATLRRAFPGAMDHAVRFPPAREGHGMTGSGLFIVNPPYGTDAAAVELSAIFNGR